VHGKVKWKGISTTAPAIPKLELLPGSMFSRVVPRSLAGPRSQPSYFRNMSPVFSAPFPGHLILRSHSAAIIPPIVWLLLTFQNKPIGLFPGRLIQLHSFRLKSNDIVIPIIPWFYIQRIGNQAKCSKAFPGNDFKFCDNLAQKLLYIIRIE